MAEAEDLRAAAKRESEQLRLAAEQETKELRGQRQARGGAGPCRRRPRGAGGPTHPGGGEGAARHARRPSTTPAPPPRPAPGRGGRAAGRRRRGSEPRAATAQANTHRQQAQTEAEALLSRARREAEQIVASARTQADAITASGHAEAERELAALKAEVDRMTKRREAIAAQLGSLRDVVAGFGEDDAVSQDSAPAAEPTGAESGSPGAKRRRTRAPTRRRRTTTHGEDGTSASPDRRSRPALAVLHRLLRRPRRFAGLVARRPDRTRSARVLILIVVALFLAAGPQPGRRVASSAAGMRRSLAVLVVIVLVLARGAVPGRDRAGDHRPGRARSPTTLPTGSTSSSTTGRSRSSTTQYDVIDKAQDYVPGGEFAGSLFGGVLGVGLAVLGALANTFIVIVLTLYFLSSLEKTKKALYRLAPASRRERVTKLGDRVVGASAATSPARSSSRCAPASARWSSCSWSGSASTPSRWPSWSRCST